MSWSFIQNQLINTSFGLLLVSLTTYWCNIAFPDIKQLHKISRIITMLINLLISISLSSRWLVNHYFPLSNLYESLLFLTWCLTSIHIFIEQNTHSQLVGAISAPIQLFTIAFASLSLPNTMQKAMPLVPALRSNWLMMHVTIIMLSYACLIIGSLLSIVFLIINQYQSSNNNLLKPKITYASNDTTVNINTTSRKSYNLLTRMNLLQNLDNLSYRTIGLGFPLLTIGIISGAVWANDAWGSYWSWDPKETWALITWLIFAAYLHSRLNKSWQGQKPAILASLGFFVIWICYLGVNFLGKGLHSYGWIS